MEHLDGSLSHDCIKPYRSWGEAQIGRLLDRHRIPYLYEHPLAIVDDQGMTRIWYPDFQLRGYGVIVEYFGRPDDQHYLAGMTKKQRVYEGNGLTTFMVTPDSFHGNWPAKILGGIENALADRLVSFRKARNGHASYS